MLSMPRIVRPDPHRFWRARNLGPPLDRPLADPLSETKNWRNLLTGRRGSQVSHSLPALAPEPRRACLFTISVLQTGQCGVVADSLAFTADCDSSFEKRLSIGGVSQLIFSDLLRFTRRARIKNAS